MAILLAISSIICRILLIRVHSKLGDSVDWPCAARVFSFGNIAASRYYILLPFKGDNVESCKTIDLNRRIGVERP
jgi:hypothetical protein